MTHRHLPLLIVLCLAAALPATAADRDSELVYIGTRGGGTPPGAATMPANPDPQGIYAARLDLHTGHLTPLGLQVELRRATWLVVNPGKPVLYCVAESADGPRAESNLHSFAIDPVSGQLHPLNSTGSGGVDATHFGLDLPSRTLVVANHGSGDVTAVPLQADGSLGKVVSTGKNQGTGPHRRQTMPQPHGIAIAPDHRAVAVADFGADRIFLYRFDPATRTLTPAPTTFESTPPGSGPRHLVFHPRGRFLYLNTELTAQLFVYDWDAKQARLKLLQSVSPYPADYAGTQEKSSAEILLSRNGRTLYVSLRADQDSIVVYSVDQRGGTLKEIQRVASQGKMPWSLGIDPTGNWLLATNAGSNSVAVFRVERASGKLTATGESLSIPQPATVAFLAN